VCRRIARGEYVKDIEKVPGMPSADTIHGWAVDDLNGFFGLYMRARRVAALGTHDEQRQIADASGLDVTLDPVTGKVIVNGETVRRAELRIKTRQWAEERLYEKVFGTKLKVEDVTPPTDEAIESRVATLLTKAGPGLLALLEAHAKGQG
jgi:hypothetical protein